MLVDGVHFEPLIPDTRMNLGMLYYRTGRLEVVLSMSVIMLQYSVMLFVYICLFIFRLESQIGRFVNSYTLLLTDLTLQAIKKCISFTITLLYHPAFGVFMYILVWCPLLKRLLDTVLV